ncbi:hypothetical protein NT05LI_3541, partial [Listeria ivanovii FSL F6-596]
MSGNFDGKNGLTNPGKRSLHQLPPFPLRIFLVNKQSFA